MQLVRRPGADTLLVAFCGFGARIHRMSMALSLFQRWLNPLGFHVIYLRDFRRLAYQDGVTPLGEGLAPTVEALRGMAHELEVRRVMCVGVSAGGYGALSYAGALGAERVLAFSPATNLDPAFNTYLRWSEGSALLSRRFPGGEFDLRPRLAAQGGRPGATIVYGAQCWDDRFHAEHLAGLPGVELRPIDGFRGHMSAAELVHRGEFGALLQDVLGR